MIELNRINLGTVLNLRKKEQMNILLYFKGVSFTGVEATEIYTRVHASLTSPLLSLLLLPSSNLLINCA